MAPRPHDVQIFPKAGAFRAWLDEHHDDAPELWVGYYRKGVDKSAMTYVEAVEEALCYGWIDGITYRIDDETTATRFTPRRKGSGWSAVNLARVAELTSAGRMHPAGIGAFEGRDRRKDAAYSYERAPQELPPEWTDRLRTDPAAWAYWEAERPSYRRTAVHWVVSAKRAETRERRFSELLAASRAGTRPRPFLVSREERSG